MTTFERLPDVGYAWICGHIRADIALESVSIVHIATGVKCRQRESRFDGLAEKGGVELCHAE